MIDEEIRVCSPRAQHTCFHHTWITWILLCWSIVNESPPLPVLHYTGAALHSLQCCRDFQINTSISKPSEHTGTQSDSVAWAHSPHQPHSLLLGVGCGRPSCALMAHRGPFKIIKKDDRRLQAGLRHYGPMFVLFDELHYCVISPAQSMQSDTKH